MRYFNYALVLAAALVLSASPALAEGAQASGGVSLNGLAAGIAMAGAAIGGTFSQGKTASSVLDAIGRNPAASGKLFVPFILGMVFIESLVLFSWLIASGLAGK